MLVLCPIVKSHIDEPFLMPSISRVLGSEDGSKYISIREIKRKVLVKYFFCLTGWKPNSQTYGAIF